MAWRGPVKPVTNPTPRRDTKKLVQNDSMLPPDASRASQIRRDKDTVKNFSVSLLDVDTTIFSYLDTVISPQVVDNGQSIKVPINYASPEAWKAIRKDGFMRDKHGKVQTPAITFRRTTMQRNDNLITLNRHLSYPTTKGFSEKNKYDKFSVMTGFAPRKEIYTLAAPDHIIVNYDFIVWTDYVEQMNKVVEMINFATEDYWGDKVRFKFRTSISDYAFQTEVAAETDRVVKSTFSMMVYAYLLPDKFENHQQTTRKAFTPRKVVFNTETVSSTTTGPITTNELSSFSAGARSETPAILSNNPPPTVSSNNPNGRFTSLNITNGAAGSINVSQAVSTSVTATVDTLPTSSGNSASWLVTINDGTNFRTSQVIANWNSAGTEVNFTEFGTNGIGTVTAELSVEISGGNVLLKINPTAGAWSVRSIRTVI